MKDNLLDAFDRIAEWLEHGRTPLFLSYGVIVFGLLYMLWHLVKAF